MRDRYGVNPNSPSQRIEDRTAQIERLARDGQRWRVLSLTDGPYEHTFIREGVLAVWTSTVFRCRSKLNLVQIMASLVSSGTTPTVVVVYRNGVSFHSVTILAGAVDLSLDVLTPNVPDEDRWQVGVTSAGTGATGLTVQLRWD